MPNPRLNRRAHLRSLAVLAVLVAAPVLPQRADASTPTTKRQAAIAAAQKAALDPEAPNGQANHDTALGHKLKSTASAGNVDQSASLAVQSTGTGGTYTKTLNLPTNITLPGKAGTWPVRAYHIIPDPRNDNFLLVAGSGNDANTFAAGTFAAFIWTPYNGVTKALTAPTDMFCGGHVSMADGEALVVGGTSAYSPIWTGSKAVYTFSFVTNTFTRRTDMQVGRWYPTATIQPNSNILITGGLDELGVNSGTSETYDKMTNMTSMTSGPSNDPFPLYPRIWSWKGREFYDGVALAEIVRDDGTVHPPGFWDPYGSDSFLPVPGLVNPSRRGEGTSCWSGDVRSGNLVVLGGGWPATSSANYINLKAASPQFTPLPSLPTAKAYVSCVELPNGAILEMNGGTANHIANTSREVSVLTSIHGSRWWPMNPLPLASGDSRLYHSLEFMNRYGSVVTMGSNPAGEARSYTVHRFYPSYLYKGTRPSLTAAPSTIKYGQTIKVTVSANTSYVSLTTMCSPTHGMDVNCRQVHLPVNQTTHTVTLNFTNDDIPPGYVWLWAVSTTGNYGYALTSHLTD